MTDDSEPLLPEDDDDAQSDDDGQSPAPADENGPVPTPEQSAAIRAAMLSPQMKEQMARITRSVNALSGLNEAYARAVAESVRPATEAISRWYAERLALNSDIFKKIALTQLHLEGVAAKLAQNVDFGSISDTIAAQQAELLVRLTPTLRAVRAAYYPPNLRLIERIRFEQVEEVAMVDGIALYGVPRAEVAEALILADGANERRDVLVTRWQEIAADCRAALNTCANPELGELASAAHAALDAFEAGHEHAAQVLAASVIDSALRGHVRNHNRFLPKKADPRPDIYDEISTHQSIAFLPLLQAYQSFYTSKDDPVPEVFNRHACAHTVSPVQVNRCNAMQGLLLACSLVHFLDVGAVFMKL